MKVGVSAEWLGSRAGGLETYTGKLIDALGRVDSDSEYLVYTPYAGALDGVTLRSPNIRERPMRWRTRWYTVPVGIPLRLMRERVDLFHATSVAPPMCPAAMVVTIHDLGFWRRPEFYPTAVRWRLSALIGGGARRARRIIAVSQATKRDIVERYRIDERNVHVVYNGVDPQYRPIDERARIEAVLQRYAIPTPYVLYVGRQHPGKNLARLLEAFDLIRRRGLHDLHLVMAGTPMYFAESVYRRVKELGLERFVNCPGYVDAADLPALYNGARAFAYPSLFEGFGLPPLEAMRCGVPTLVSDASCLPEIVGDGALIAKALDVQDLADKLFALVTDEALRADLKERGAKRAAQFSWEQTARDTLAVYREATN